MHRDEATRYATALQREAQEHHFDPFTGVALIHRESHWHPSAVSKDGEDYGLAQIRARYIGACRSDLDPVNHPSEACKRVKRSLLDGVHNIRVMATLITRNREFCRSKTGTAFFAQWLASYEGRNYPRSNRWCSPTSATQGVVQHQKALVAQFAPPKPRKRSKRKVKSGQRSTSAAATRSKRPRSSSRTLTTCPARKSVSAKRHAKRKVRPAK